MANRLIIIGGGVLGTFHAYHALEHGFAVTLFEKDTQPRGATTQNFGQIVPSGMDLEWQRYGRRSLALYKELHRTIGLEMQQSGSLYIASNPGEWQLLEELYQINQAEGYPSQLLDAAACLRRYPGLKASYCQGGLFFPEEISVEPRSMIRRVLHYLAEQKGLDYRPATLVRAVDPSHGGCRVTDHRGRVHEADHVLICSGSEFHVLFPELFAQSPLQAVKLHMMQTQPQARTRIKGNLLTGLTIRRYESFRACPSHAEVTAEDDPQAFWKQWGIHLLFKQSLDGGVVIGDSHEYADAAVADALGYDLHAPVQAYIRRAAQDIYDLDTWEMRREWYGIYSQCKGQDIFQHSLDDHIHILTGIGGKGMTAGPGFSQAHFMQRFL